MAGFSWPGDLGIFKDIADKFFSGPKKLGLADALSLAVLALFGASACTREVVVKEAPAPSAASSASASSAPPAAVPSVTVSPVSDRSKLCSRARGRSYEIYNPSQVYWDTVHKSGFGAPDVADAGDQFREAVVKVIPQLKGLIGPDAPKDVADAINEYADTADKFSEAAGAHSTGDEINPLASAFGNAIDRFKAVCGKG